MKQTLDSSQITHNMPLSFPVYWAVTFHLSSVLRPQKDKLASCLPQWNQNQGKHDIQAFHLPGVRMMMGSISHDGAIVPILWSQPEIFLPIKTSQIGHQPGLKAGLRTLMQSGLFSTAGARSSLKVTHIMLSSVDCMPVCYLKHATTV